MGRARQRAWAVIGLAGGLFLAACSDADPTDDATEETATAADDAEATATGTDGGVTPLPEGRLACEAQGYPCTWAEVDDGLLAKASELGAELDTATDGTWDVDSLAETLSARDDVADAAIGTDSLWFRLEGAKPVWVFADDTFVQPGPERDDASDASAAGAGAARDPHAVLLTAATVPSDPDATLPRVPPATPSAVVGDDHESKSALVLSIHEYENLRWGADEVAQTLEGTRGYEGNVDFRSNSAPDEGSIGPDDFLGWDAYDVVFVGTHGTQICADTCWTALSLGATPAEAEAGETGPELLDEFGYADTPGVTIAWGNGLALPVVQGDWVAAQYGGGLDDTLVWIQACSSARAGDLTAGLAGPRSVFLGWSHPAFANDAGAAAERFFREAADRGVTSTTAYDELRADGSHRSQGTNERETGYAPGDTVYRWEDGELRRVDPPTETTEVDATLRHHQPGMDLRIREVVELQHPETTEMLTDGDEAFADGDLLPVRIQVDGILDEQADAVEVTLTVNGIELAEGWRLTDPQVTKVEDEVYLVEDEVSLPADTANADRLTLDARASLPEGDESRHVVELAIEGYELVLDVELTASIAGDLLERSHVEGSFPLTITEEGSAWSGDAPPDWLTYTLELGGPCRGGGGTLSTTSDVGVPHARIDPDGAELDLRWREDIGGPEVPCGAGGTLNASSEHEIAVTALMVALGAAPLEGAAPEQLLDFVGEDTVRFDEWEPAEGGGYVYERSGSTAGDGGGLRGTFRMELRPITDRGTR